MLVLLLPLSSFNQMKTAVLAVFLVLKEEHSDLRSLCSFLYLPSIIAGVEFAG